MIEHIPELIEAGIDSFKIEGRMKTALYVATVARTYRLAIDEFLRTDSIQQAFSLENRMKTPRFMIPIRMSRNIRTSAL